MMDNKDNNQELLNAIELLENGKVKQLLESGADPNWGQGIYLSRAVQVGDMEIINLLLDHNASPNVVNGDPLARAVALGNMKIIRLLLERGAQVDIFDNVAAKNACNLGRLEELKLLIEHGASLGDVFYRLIEAAEGGRMNIVRFLIEEKGVYFGYKSMVPMKDASVAGQTDVVEYFLEHLFANDSINEQQFKVIQAYLEEKHYPLLKKAFLTLENNSDDNEISEEIGL